MRGRPALTLSKRRQAGCGCSVLTFLFGLAALNSLESGMCGTTVYARSRPPSGLVEARVQMTDCGATTGYSRVVWMQPSWFRHDRALSCRAVALDHEPAVELSWTDRALIVATDAPRESLIAAAGSCYGWRVEVRHVPPRRAPPSASRHLPTSG